MQPFSNSWLYEQVTQEEGEHSGSSAARSVALRGRLAPGLIWLEAQRAGLLGSAAPLLVLPPGQHALAAEVQRIISSAPDQATQQERAGPAAHGSPGSRHAGAAAADACNSCCEGFLADLGLVVRHGCPAASEEAVPDLATRTARHLLAFACDAGAPSLAAFLLPAASVGCASGAEVVARVHAAESNSGGSTLLHRALRSGCSEIIDGLLSWGAQHDYQWQAWLPTVSSVLARLVYMETLESCTARELHFSV